MHFIIAMLLPVLELTSSLHLLISLQIFLEISAPYRLFSYRVQTGKKHGSSVNTMNDVKTILH